MGVLAGIAAGAVIGVLFAPEKGEVTRKKIVRKGEDLAEEVNNKLEEKFNELITAISGGLKKNKTQNDIVKSPVSDVASS